MKLEEMVLISVDDHVVEPPHLYEGRLPLKYKSRAPRVVRTPAGADAWLFEDRVLPLGHVGSNIAFRDGVDVVTDPNGYSAYTFDDLRPGVWNIDERIKDMDLNGQLAGMCFPQMARFAGQVFTECHDKDFALAALRAYNDWHVDEWAGSYPGRMMPLGVLPMWSADLAADEVRRLSTKGCHAVTFSIIPYRLGLPSVHSDAWDPLWTACADTATVVCMHLGSDSTPILTSPDAPTNVVGTLTPMTTVWGAVDLIWSPVFRKFPIKVALSEGGIGWIPWVLHRLDHSLTAHAFTGQNFEGRRPSDVFRERFITCFIDDPHGVRSRHEIGIESICVEVDYPHFDSMWPRSPEALFDQFCGLDDDEINSITHRNAMRHFDFNPFALASTEACSVGALRARASAPV